MHYGKEVVNAPEPTGLSPVIRCVFEGQMAPLLLLVAAGADLAARDSENWTALHVTVSMDDKYAAQLILHLCKMCLISVRNVDGETPINLAESNDMANLLTSAQCNHTFDATPRQQIYIDALVCIICFACCICLACVAKSLSGFEFNP